MRQSYGLSICRLLSHLSNGASILRLEVLKDILDDDYVLDFIVAFQRSLIG